MFGGEGSGRDTVAVLEGCYVLVRGHVTCLSSLSSVPLSSEYRLMTSRLSVQTFCCYAQ